MNTCVIEALYPEVCNLFGDTGNLRYLKLCLPQATFIETALNDEPYFVHHPVSMIYLGPMSEHTQCIIISKLAPYRERIAECIANGVTFLATGNAMEVFGKQITDAQSGVTTGLGLLDLTTTRCLALTTNCKWWDFGHSLPVPRLEQQKCHLFK